MKVNGSHTKARPRSTYRQAEERPDVAPAPLPGSRWCVSFEETAGAVILLVSVVVVADGAHHAWKLAAPVLGGRAYSAVKVAEIVRPA